MCPQVSFLIFIATVKTLVTKAVFDNYDFPYAVFFSLLSCVTLGSLDRLCQAKTVFPWGASRANMLYLAARTHNRAAVCLHAAHIAALWEFWTNWLPWHGNTVLA